MVISGDNCKGIIASEKGELNLNFDVKAGLQKNEHH